MSSVLVTGGAGFIGSHSCLLLLENGFEVIVLDSLINSSFDSIVNIKKILSKNHHFKEESLHFIKGDLRDYSLLRDVFTQFKNRKKTIDYVIHFAGLKSVSDSVNDPLSYWDANINGTINLLKVMGENNCTDIVFSSSATIYGLSKSFQIKEDSPTNPLTPYGNTKYTIEKILKDVFNSLSKDWRIINLRYFNPIGAHPSGLLGEDPLGIPNNIFPFITQVASGKLSTLKIFGNDWPTSDGTGVRDYIHVMDLAEGHIAALAALKKHRSQYTSINLGTGIGTSVLELIRTF